MWLAYFFGSLVDVCMGTSNPIYEELAQNWAAKPQPFKRELPDLHQRRFEDMMSDVSAYATPANKMNPNRIGEMALLSICLEQQRRIWELSGYVESLEGRLVDIGGEPIGMLYRKPPEFSGED